MTGARNNDTSIELVRRERPEGEMPMELRQRLSRVIDSFPRDVRDKQRTKREASSEGGASHT